KHQAGVELDNGPARFEAVEPIGGSDSHAWFRVVLKEGRNREVRRMWDAVGLMVSRLKRIRYGSIELPRNLRRGQFEEVAPDRVEALRRELKLNKSAGTLTLQPVTGARRARKDDMAPAPRPQRAWTQGTYGDEGRELRAFDVLREDASARPGRGRRPAGKGGQGRRARGNVPDDIGNRINAQPAGKQRRSGGARRKGAAPGYENPAEFRSWYVPEGAGTGPGAFRPANGQPPGRGGQGKGPGRGRPGAPGRPGGGNRSQAAPNGASRPGRGRGGNRPIGAPKGPRPGGGNRPRGGNKPH